MLGERGFLLLQRAVGGYTNRQRIVVTPVVILPK